MTMTVKTNKQTKNAILTLGPVQFNWPADKRRDFYFRMADEAPVDVVYLGENVCAKRTPFFDPFIPEIAERLLAAGKQVVLSTLALVMDKREQERIRELCLANDFLIEANDVGTVAMLGTRSYIVGPFVNVYNEGSAQTFVNGGAEVIVLNNELPGTTIRSLVNNVPDCAFEVQAFGRLPLAISARCYHARVHGLHKDGCQYVCEQDADGMDVETLDDEDFLSVNGTQTLSHRICDLSAEIHEMMEFGVRRFRLWPHWVDMVKVSNLYRQLLNGDIDAGDMQTQLQSVAGFAEFANGFYHRKPGADHITS